MHGCERWDSNPRFPPYEGDEIAASLLRMVPDMGVEPIPQALWALWLNRLSYQVYKGQF